MGQHPGRVVSRTPMADVRPINDDELILRRIPPSYYSKEDDSAKTPIRTFLPRKWKDEHDRGDVDGLSVDRESMTTHHDAARNPMSGEIQSLTRVSVTQLHELELSARAAPIDGNPAHVRREIRIDPAVRLEGCSGCRRRSDLSQRVHGGKVIASRSVDEQEIDLVLGPYIHEGDRLPRVFEVLNLSGIEDCHALECGDVAARHEVLWLVEPQ